MVKSVPTMRENLKQETTKSNIVKLNELHSLHLFPSSKLTLVKYLENLSQIIFIKQLHKLASLISAYYVIFWIRSSLKI